MVRTLHKYLGRDLIKVAVLALVVSTLLFTVFAIVEPLRKRGLASGQVAELVFYTIPIMLSMTLPVAALFAATMVYGRFGQDNEMTACRASGVSTLNVLCPALALGITVSIISMLLSNYVTPRMAELLQVRVKDNIMALISKELESQGYYEPPGKTSVVHADSVVRNPEGMTLYGVVVVDGRKPDNVRVVTASKAHTYFINQKKESYVSVGLIEPMAFHTKDGSEAQEDIQSITFKLPNPVKDDPTWYDWKDLLEASKDPTANAEIRDLMGKMRTDMVHDMFIDAIIRDLGPGRIYRGLGTATDTYWVQAPVAQRDPGKGVVLASQMQPDGSFVPVTVTVLRNGRWHERITANNGRIAMGVKPIDGRSVISIELSGTVESQTPEGPSQISRHSQRSFGEMSIPAAMVAAAAKVPDSALLAGDPNVIHSGQRYLPELAKKITLVRAKILSEIHRRLAMACSCFVLVAMGAAMGLLLRGGQILTAFVITTVLSAMVLILIMAGTQMITNITTHAVTVGLWLIWGGVIGMTIGTSAIFTVLCRR